MITGKCVVSWLDPAFSLDDEDVEPCLVETMGWMVSEDETRKYVVIASERLGKDDHRGFTAIPNSLIISVETLESTDGREKEVAESADRSSEEGQQKAS